MGGVPPDREAILRRRAYRQEAAKVVRTAYSQFCSFRECFAHLEDHARGDDGSDTQLHEGTSVTGHHHTKPVKRIRRVRRHNAVQRHLAHDQEDEEGQTRPYQAVVERNLALGQLDFRDEGDKRFDQIEEPYCQWSVSLACLLRRGQKQPLCDRC